MFKNEHTLYQIIILKQDSDMLMNIFYHYIRIKCRRISMVSYIDIVKRLIHYHKSHRITQIQLAEIFSVTQCEVSKLESNEYRISYHDLLQLHTKTDLDIDFLITGKSAKTTIFHTLEKELLSPLSAARYSYTDLILFSLNKVSESDIINNDEMNGLKYLQRLLRYSFLSGNKQKDDCWLNVRNAFNLTQIKMAEIMDVDIKRYRNIEKGIRTANAELLMNIYNALEIYPSYFIYGKIENYEHLEQIFQNISLENQREIVEFLKAGIKFINQTMVIK